MNQIIENDPLDFNKVMAEAFKVDARIEGREEGREEERMFFLKRLIEVTSMTDSEIARAIQTPVAQVQKLRKEIESSTDS